MGQKGSTMIRLSKVRRNHYQTMVHTFVLLWKLETNQLRVSLLGMDVNYLRYRL